MPSEQPAAQESKKLRIAVMARGLSVPVGGVRRYIEQMVRRLPLVDPESTYGIFHNSERHVGTFSMGEEVYHPTRNTWWWENAWFPSAVKRWKADVVFCPKNLVPFGLPSSVRVVTCLLDMAYFPVRGSYLAEYKFLDVAYMRLALPHSLARSDHLVCISDHTRADVHELFDVPAKRMSTVLLGVEQPAEDALTEEKLKEVRQAYNLYQPYVFYAGSLSPRKNISRLVRALASIADQVPHQLVVTGGKSWKDRAVFEAVESSGFQDRFVQLGAVPDEDMPALYRMADVFTFPSLFEGFGLPVLEAMACGCPVLTSSTTSLPEAAGDAAVLIDPIDEQAIAHTLLRMLTDEEERSTWRERGLRRAVEMNWNRTARGLVDVFHQVVSDQGLQT